MELLNFVLSLVVLAGIYFVHQNISASMTGLRAQLVEVQAALTQLQGLVEKQGQRSNQIIAMQTVARQETENLSLGNVLLTR